MAEKLLDKINYPSDLRKLEKSQLEQVSNELRNELIDVVSETGKSPILYPKLKNTFCKCNGIL